MTANIFARAGKHVAGCNQWRKPETGQIIGSWCKTHINKHFIISTMEEKRMNIKREIKSYIVKEGISMHELVERLHINHKWSKSVSNFSGKLQRGTLRYSEAHDIANELGYEIVWVKKGSH